MTVVTIPYRPRIQQWDLHLAMQDHRYGVGVCHRRFGKSVCFINELVKRALSTEKTDWRGSYVGPTYTQVKAIIWDYAKYYTKDVPGRVINESELRIDFPNGSRIRLFGGDKPDALRGLYHDCVVLDEFDDTKANLWTQVIYPATVDRQGCAYFIGTYIHTDGPLAQIYDQAERDEEWFALTYRASETGIVDERELKLARRTMTEEEYEREFECNRSAAVKGAYYAKQLFAAEKEGRLTTVKHDPTYTCVSGWDIGFDTTAVWTAQVIGNQYQMIDYFEVMGVDITEPAAMILDDRIGERKWRYSMHYFPHDMEARDWTAGNQTRLETARRMGLNPATAVPRRVAQKLLDEHEGINAVRRAFPRMVFDTEACKRGLDCLRSYRPKVNAHDEIQRTPEHDWASHGATALEQLVRGHVGFGGRKQPTNRKRDTRWIV